MKKTGNYTVRKTGRRRSGSTGRKVLLTSGILLVSFSVIVVAIILIGDGGQGPVLSGSGSSSGFVSGGEELSEVSSEDLSQESADSLMPVSSGIESIPVSPTPAITHGPMFFGQKNPVLLGGNFNRTLVIGAVISKALPASLNFTSVIYKGNQVLQAYNRPDALTFYDPADYSSVAGVLGFRGNNFRNSPSFGYTSMKEKKLEQIWERRMGGMPSSSWDFSWSGTGWTGQPVMIQWDEDVRRIMNLNQDKKNKEGLVEVITAAMDGKIYFYDLQDGKETRPAINIGVAVKGTPAIDPRGYPLLYVGQGDYPPKTPGGEMGFRVFNLIDQSLLHFQNTGKETRSYRNSWGASDSSPLIDAETDTLIYPCENGMIYTAKLNTVFDKQNGTISISPEFVDYKYKSSATTSQGIESSIAIYGSLGYFADNSGAINCVDLNTLKPVWSKRLDDDNDVTPVLQQEGDKLFLYCGTEVDNQKPIKGVYKGEAYVYKIDALTGETIWRNSYPAYTYNDPERSGNDINGGIMGSFIIGKGRYSNLVLVSICMTEGYSSGNTIAAFDTATGDLVWDYKMNHYSWGSPVDVYDSNGKMYVLMTDSVSQVHLVDGDTGERLHYIQIMKGFAGAEPVSGGNIESSAAVFGDYLVIGTRGGVLAGVRLR